MLSVEKQKSKLYVQHDYNNDYKMENMHVYNVQGKDWNKIVQLLNWLVLGGDIKYF